MAALADLERLLERVFERSSTRLFRARIQVVQVEHKVERAMERARITQGAWTVVPSRYRVRLHPADLEQLGADVGGPAGLAGRLADSALAFARGHGYHLAGRPSVALVADPGVERGTVEVEAVADDLRPSAGPDRPAAQAPIQAATPPAPAQAPAQGPTTSSPASPPPAPPTPVGSAQPVPATEGGGIRGDGTQAIVVRRTPAPPARAMLRVVTPDGRERVIPVDGTPTTLGRADDNVLLLADTRVSRHHGRLQVRNGALAYTDLASTNGSLVNSVRVDECVLGVGDRLRVGDTVLLVEQLPG